LPWLVRRLQVRAGAAALEHLAQLAQAREEEVRAG
jgi:hypothetical protein